MDRGAWGAAVHGIMKTQLSKSEHTAHLASYAHVLIGPLLPAPPLRFLGGLSLLCPARRAGAPQVQALLPFLLCNTQLFLRGIRSLPAPSTPTWARMTPQSSFPGQACLMNMKLVRSSDIQAPTQTKLLHPPLSRWSSNHPKELHHHPSSWVSQTRKSQPY